MKYQIRKAIHQDADKIIEAHRRSIRQVCSKDYNPDQIAEWSGRNFKTDRWCQTIDNDFVWVIANDVQSILGFGHLRFSEESRAEIAGLYFTPEVIGSGLGKEMIQIMLNECKNNNINLISLLSTKTAQNFYAKCGFIQIGEMSSIQMGEQLIECYKMELQLVT